MTDEFWKNLPLTLTALASIIATVLGFWNNRLLRIVRHETNHMKDELVKVTGEAEHAKGVKQGEATVARRG